MRFWVFRNTGANAFAKNQMRLAYEDKRDLYCNTSTLIDNIYVKTFLKGNFRYSKKTFLKGNFRYSKDWYFGSSSKLYELGPPN